MVRIQAAHSLEQKQISLYQDPVALVIRIFGYASMPNTPTIVMPMNVRMGATHQRGLFESTSFRLTLVKRISQKREPPSQWLSRSPISVK